MPELFIPRFFEPENPLDLGYEIAFSGKYKVQVCRNGRVVREPFGDRWLPNLITNYGLDQACQGNGAVAWLVWARVGTGTTTPAVTDTALVAQTQSSGTYPSSGNGTTIDTTNGAATHTLIFTFAAVGSAVGLNELGISASPSGANLCTRALFPVTVSLNTGDNLQLTYSLTESIPATITPVTVSMSAVNGFNPSGQLKVVGTFAQIFGSLSANGTPTIGQQSELHFGATNAMNLCSAPSTFPAVNALPTVTLITGAASNTPTFGTYTAGTFTRSKSVVWVPSAPSSTVSNVIWISLAGSGGSNIGLILLLSSAQTKANTNTLTITTSITVSRI